MKTALAILVAIPSLIQGAQAVACAPPPSPLYVQPASIAEIVSSRVVFEALLGLGARSIARITPTSVGYEIQADNGCSVTAKIIYKEPDVVGMCPQRVGVKIVQSSCSN